MSTQSKLNPKAREDRMMRAAMVRDLTKQINAMLKATGPGDPRAAEMITVRNFLHHVARSSQRTNDEKNRLFQAIARELSGVHLARQS